MQHKSVSATAASGNFQIIEGGKEIVTHAQQMAIVEQLRTHGHGIQAVAKRAGRSYNQVVAILIQRTELEKQVAYNRGFVAGRLSNGPRDPGMARRAA